MTDTVWDAEVRISLRKSKVRREVLRYLVEIHPKKVYASEIVKETDLRINDVCGALNGSSNRYKKESSLVELGLVEKDEREGTCFYSATERGKKMWNRLRTEYTLE